MISAYTIEKDYQQGPTLETLVFSSLIRKCQQVHYFLTEKGQEVDFFVTFQDQSKHLFQVTLSLKDASTRKREITALQQAMQETGIEESYIITMDETETLSLEEGTIHVLPLLQFLLEGVA